MAKWMERGADCICSNCERKVIDDGWNIGEYTTPYCPWCGAAMENPCFENDTLKSFCDKIKAGKRKVYAVYGEYEDHEGYYTEELLSLHETEESAREYANIRSSQQTYPVKWEDGQYLDFRVSWWEVEPIKPDTHGDAK